VRVAAPPEGGRANEAVRDLLSSVLAVSRADVEIVAGAGARDKLVSVRGIEPAELERLLAAAAGLVGA